MANSDEQKNAIRWNKKKNDDSVYVCVLRKFCRKSKINVARISRSQWKTTWISFKGEMIMQITYVAGTVAAVICRITKNSIFDVAYASSMRLPLNKCRFNE